MVESAAGRVVSASSTIDFSSERIGAHYVDAPTLVKPVMDTRDRPPHPRPRRDAVWRGPLSLIAPLFAALCAATVCPQQVLADLPADDAEFALPTHPNDLGALLIVEPSLELVFPVASDSLCPDGPDRGCVFGSGFGLGVLVERRSRRGIGIGGAYGMSLMDGGGVYEFTTVQTFSVSLRGYFLEHNFVHPMLGVSAGLALFGEAFRADTLGLVADVSAGVELEMTRTLAMTAALDLRMLYFRGFTSAEGRQRGGGGLDFALALRVGLVLEVGR